jgi:hypothetical protein
MSVQRARSADQRQAEPLNPVDCAMLSVDRFLRAVGHPGFETQMVLWLGGRLDVDRLQQAIARLAAEHPLLTARLHDTPSPHWQLAQAGGGSLREVQLESPDDQAVLEHLAQGLSQPADPRHTDPLRYSLLHRPDGRDVLVLQYNHTLLDNRATVALVRHLDRMASGNGPADGRSAPGNIWQVLRKHDRTKRRAAAKRAVDVWWQSIRGSAAMLRRPPPAPQRLTKVKIAVRRLSAEQSRAFHQWVLKTCGMPTVSMALLASVFRVMDRLSDDRRKGTAWIAGLGVDLGLRRPGSLMLHNLMSIMPMRADREQLGDRGQLARDLSRQMRSHLENEIDLGTLQLIAVNSRRAQRMRWIIDGCMTWAFSMWYSYFGNLDGAGDRLLDVPIEGIDYIGPCWSPLGITLLASQFHGRLALQASYLPEVISAELAEQLLDGIVDEISRTGDR